MKEEQKIGFGLVLRAIAKKDDKLLLLQRPSKSSHDNGRWELPIFCFRISTNASCLIADS